MIVWNYDDLQNWIKEGCDTNISKNIFSLTLSNCNLNKIPLEVFYLTQLQMFHCRDNKIKKIPKKIRCLTQLQTFVCDGNNLKKIPIEIRYLTQLQYFSCYCNHIKKIPKEISYLTQLHYFHCDSNHIKKIPKEIKYLTQLHYFNCVSNHIKKIPKEIKYLTQLHYFYCHSNHIKKIPKEIKYLTQLHYFYCNSNHIKKIPKEIRYLTLLQEFHCRLNQINTIPIEIGNLTHLQTFDCYGNKIKEIPIEIINCRRLQYFYFGGNEIDYIQPQIRRWLNGTYHRQQIYSDTQSVHNHSIQEGVSNSINYITSIKPSIQIEQLKELIINNQYLDEHVKRLLFEYIDIKEVHSILNITFEELLLSVYDFIEKNENKEELFKIMNDEISEANCKCFTGRISRLINVLNGYDEHIEIHIADNEQIGNIIVLIKNDLGENYNEIEFKKRIHEELTLRHYSEDVINEWIENI